MAIHLSLLLGLETLRYALLTSLVRFTFLHAPREMRMKNVEAMRLLLQIADQEPAALQARGGGQEGGKGHGQREGGARREELAGQSLRLSRKIAQHKI